MGYNKIYLKITTLPQTGELQTDSLEFELFKDKYSEAREYMKDSDVLHSYYNDSSKTASFAQIHSITIGCVDEGKAIIKVIKGEEKDILQNLVNTLNSDNFKDAELVCFNLGFNLGFLTTRMLKNRLSTKQLPKQLSHLNKKPWEVKGCKGLSEYYSGISWFRMNFKELCFVSGLSTEKILDGEDVYNYYKAGRVEDIDNSDVSYLFNLINVERISQDEEVIVSLDTYFQTIEEEVASVDDRTFLEKLYSTNNFTSELQEELKSIIGKKKLTKVDKTNLFTILRGVLLRTDFVNEDQDNKATKNKKEEQVTNFINSL